MDGQKRFLIIGQGIAGSCLACRLLELGCNVVVVDRPVHESASRVAAGLVNPLTGRAFHAGWHQSECFAALRAFYPATEAKFGGKWWQTTPIFRELAGPDEEELWQERQTEPESCEYAGPMMPWPEGWDAPGKAAYTRGSGVLHVEKMVNAMRDAWVRDGIFREGEVAPEAVCACATGGVDYAGEHFDAAIWANGYEAGQHPAMLGLKGRPSKGTILDLKLPGLELEAGILHYGHWLVHRDGVWRFGATYAWSWDDPGVPEAPAMQELMISLVQRYHGEVEVVRARAAVRPIIRRSQPVACPIPGLPGQYVFSGLGSKGVTTSPWTSLVLAEHLVNGTELPADFLPGKMLR